MANAPQPREHAGVSLDVHAIEHAHLPIEHVEPIPWKTGQVGAVAPIDRDTSWSLPHAKAKAEREAEQAKAHVDAVKKASGCGSGSCGCKSDAKREASEKAEKAEKVASLMASAERSRIREIADMLGIALEPPRSRPARSSMPEPKRAAATTSDAKDAKAPPTKAKPKKKLPGSGIPPRKSMRVLLWVRRASQVFFFGLFMYFLFQTGFRGSFAAKADQAVRLPLPVEAFLLADPFVGAMTVLSTHHVYRGLLWSVGLLALTLVFGRVFCGWICPFGTLHHFFGWILPSRRGRGAARVEANKTYRRQSIKYYLMYAFLLASLAGSVIGGLFDPICIAVRAIGLGVIPGVQYIAGRGLGAVQDVPLRAVQHGADATQDALATSVWQSR